MADIFDEIGDELRAERARKLLARYGWVLVVLAVAVVAAAGALQWRRDQQRRQDEAAGGAFLAAMAESTSPAPGGAAAPARKEAEDAFEHLATTAPESYRTLARLRLAALQAGSDPAAALQAWDAVAHDDRADPVLRGLATLLWAGHQIDAGDPATVEARLRPLADGAGPWRPMAQEKLAWLDLRTGKDDDARGLLRTLAADPLAPQGVRARAGGLLAQLGEAPAAAAASTPVVTQVGR